MKAESSLFTRDIKWCEVMWGMGRESDRWFSHWRTDWLLGVMFSGLWCCVFGWVVADVPKECGTFIIKGQETPKKWSPLGLLQPFRWLHSGNKMPTRCNRGFYCRLLAQHVSGTTMPIIRSSGGLCVRFAGCCSIPQTGQITLSSTPDQ